MVELVRNTYVNEPYHKEQIDIHIRQLLLVILLLLLLQLRVMIYTHVLLFCCCYYCNHPDNHRRHHICFQVEEKNLFTYQVRVGCTVHVFREVFSNFIQMLCCKIFLVCNIQYV